MVDENHKGSPEMEALNEMCIQLNEAEVLLSQAWHVLDAQRKKLEKIKSVKGT